MTNKSKKSLDINGLEYVASKVMTLVNSGGTADYLVEQGTSDIWTYRKWASGVAECWGQYTNNNVVCNGDWGVLKEAKVCDSISFPSGLFTSAPTFTVTITELACMLETTNGVTASGTPAIWALRPNTNTAATVVANMYAKGLWKEFTTSIMQSPQLDLYYPIGSIYQTSNANFDPNVTFGGTWELITNKFLIGAGDEYELGDEGGSAKYTPSGSNTGTAISTSQMPSHTHTVQIALNQSGYGYTIPANTRYLVENSGNTWTSSAMSNRNKNVMGVTDGSGSGQAHTHTFNGTEATVLPPYKAVYMWERTA